MTSDRLPLLPGWSCSAKWTAKEFYALALKAVRKRRGLLHGAFSKGSRVCAVGAVDTMLIKQGMSFAINKVYIHALQQRNDAYPQASPAERREKVIAWLEQQLQS